MTNVYERKLYQIELDVVFAFIGWQSVSISVIVESHVDEKSKELKAREAIIVEQEKIVQDKSDSIASLQSEIASLQVRH